MSEQKTTMKQSSLIFEKGLTIFREGDESREMYFITTGKVEISQKISITRDEKENKIVLATLGPGDFFGEMSTFREKARTATATAIVDSECLVMSQTTINNIIQQRPDVGIRIIKVLCDRLDKGNENVERLITMNGVERIINHFINMATSYGQKMFTETQIQFDQAVRILRDKTNLDRDVITKAIHFLDKKKFIEVYEMRNSQFIRIVKSILEREKHSELG